MDRAITSRLAVRQPLMGKRAGGTGRSQVAIDHLPTAVRRHALLAGRGFTDVGEQPAQYARLLGITPPTDNIRLFLKGIVLDGALTAVLAVYEGGRKGGSCCSVVEPLTRAI